MQSPRVLVTGAAGFIGRATTSELRARGVECIPTDLHPHPAVPDVIVGDLLNERFVNNLLQTSCSAVIHLSGILPTAARQNPLAATRANIEASCKLIEKTHKAGIGRFVFGSSLGVYGGRLGSQCISEDMPAAPEEVYGAGKPLR
jgi:nucleoside-diphosphate-sugar epimerase